MKAAASRRLGAAIALALSLALPAGAQPEVADTPTVAWVATETMDGVDPVVGRFVDRQLRRSIEATGYRAIEATPQRYPPSMAELWQTTHAAAAEHTVFAVVGAREGRYAVQLRIASRDGSGPRYAQASTGAADLEASVDAALRRVLPPPARPAPSAPLAAQPEPQAAAPAAPPARPPGRETARDFRRLRLALHSDAAIGLADPGFYNHLLGGRVDLRLERRLALGVHIAYANLEGRRGRAESVLLSLLFDYRIAIDGDAASRDTVTLPMRLALGYLLRNGAFLRVGSGLSLPLGDDVELVLDLPAAAFWVTRDRVLLSLDLGVELALGL